MASPHYPQYGFHLKELLATWPWRALGKQDSQAAQHCLSHRRAALALEHGGVSFPLLASHSADFRSEEPEPVDLMWSCFHQLYQGFSQLCYLLLLPSQWPTPRSAPTLALKSCIPECMPWGLISTLMHQDKQKSDLPHSLSSEKPHKWGGHTIHHVLQTLPSWQVQSQYFWEDLVNLSMA